MTNLTPPLPIITVTYSPGPHLETFLQTLSTATSQPVQVILADNGSTDGTPQQALERYPNVRLFTTGSNIGYGRAINAAVNHLEPTEFIVIANPDVQWGAHSIDRLLEAAQRWPQAGALGPLIRQPDGSIYPSARALPSLIRGSMHAAISPLWPNNPWTRSYKQENSSVVERSAGWLSGACLLLRRQAFHQILGFDPHYFLYMEDVDLGDRLGKAGWLNIYVPDAEITHIQGHATERDPRPNLIAHHRSTYHYLADRYPHTYQAPLRIALRMGLEARWRLLTR